MQEHGKLKPEMTNPHRQTKVREAVLQLAPIFNVDPNVVLAICKIESNLMPDKTRYEDHWKYFHEVDFYAKSLGITVRTELELQKFSWGPMQIMGSVAREEGFEEDLPNLVEPTKALAVSLKKFNKLMGKYRNLLDVVSAWNQGSPRKDSAHGHYFNQGYVDKFQSALKELKK